MGRDAGGHLELASEVGRRHPAAGQGSEAPAKGPAHKCPQRLEHAQGRPRGGRWNVTVKELGSVRTPQGALLMSPSPEWLSPAHGPQEAWRR